MARRRPSKSRPPSRAAAPVTSRAPSGAPDRKAPPPPRQLAVPNSSHRRLYALVVLLALLLASVLLYALSRLPKPPPGEGDPAGSAASSDQWLRGFRLEWLDIPSGSADLSTPVRRRFLYWVPSAAQTPSPYPVLVVFGPNSTDPFSTAQLSNTVREAELNGFIVVYPEAEYTVQSSWSWWLGWDFRDDLTQHPDVLFVLQLLDQIDEQFPLDRRRVFLAGFSRGAAMALMLALNEPDLFAGACAHSGFLQGDAYEWLNEHPPRRHVPIYLVHGTADYNVCADCRPGEACGRYPTLKCDYIYGSAEVYEALRQNGWEPGVDLVYRRVKEHGHSWRSELNADCWDFLTDPAQPETAP